MVDEVDKPEEVVHSLTSGDEIVNVTLPLNDYYELRAMLKDRKSMGYAKKKIQTLVLSISGVITAWFLMGDHISTALKRLLIGVG